MKTHTSITLDSKLLEKVRAQKLNLSNLVNDLLNKNLNEGELGSGQMWLIDKISGAKYQTTDHGIYFRNIHELHKYNNARASRGKKFAELVDEKKIIAAGEVVERSDKSQPVTE
jgi:hypothetical protein